jgi:hypothetical protein
MKKKQSAGRKDARPFMFPFGSTVVLLFFLFLPCKGFTQGGPPQITLQPQSQMVPWGSNVTFSVEASSLSYLTYQWRFNSNAIPGATNSSYVVMSAHAADEGEYSVALTNAVGWAISSNALLTITASPTIITPPTDVTQVQNGNALFSVTALGEPELFYQWHFEGGDLLGATNSNLQLSNIQAWQSGFYAVTVTNGCGTVHSSSALLTVTLPPGAPAAWGDNEFQQSIVPAPINITNSQSFDTSGSVSNPGEPEHCGYEACASYWLPYIAPQSGTLTIDTIGTEFNAVLAIYTGPNPSNVVPVACSANHGPGGELVSFPAIGGARYFVVIQATDCSVGQATINFSLSVTFSHGVKAVAAGGAHSLVLKTNGVVLGWGDNTHRQLLAPPGLSGVKAIGAGYYHSLALRNDGNVVAWGDNVEGQTNVPLGLKDVTKISAGAYHNLALLQDGSVVGWGLNNDGQTNIPSGLSNVVLIAAGYSHSLALTGGGTVVGWGSSLDGEISPPPTLSGVVALCCGDRFSLALQQDGVVMAWGNNTYGQTDVPADLTNVVAISAGRHHCLALRQDGTVVAWGLNSHGQTHVPFVISTMTAISAGAFHSLSAKGTGAPTIIAGPRSMRVPPGSDVSFPVMAVGNAPLKFQWRFNGNDIPGATKTVLTLTNVQPPDTGGYSVFVSNSLGTAMSSDALLVVGNFLILEGARWTSEGHFQFELTGPGGIYFIDFSSDLMEWPTLTTTNAPPGRIIVTDTTPPDPLRRFYRARLQ